ncbi:hypothetical protein EYF80_026103 [Liparis tanakae]|uniref:Uncharacterized protein n=1 Tax=Liparis tanakae TaxID=230148 RepID=A0A4Z2HEH0_9TELE|nr:hypothetical protein EYF80_026103 [Liparis tanakae]
METQRISNTTRRHGDEPRQGPLCRCFGSSEPMVLRFTAWALSPITLPAAATLNGAIQISCPKMANNYLFIGRCVTQGTRLRNLLSANVTFDMGP